MLAFIVTQSKTVSLTINGNVFNIGTERADYPQIAKLLKAWAETEIGSDAQALLEEEIEQQVLGTKPPLGGHAELRNGKMFFNGKEVNSTLAERIVEIDRMGLPPEPMLRFFENIMLNPSEESRTELYDFLSHKNIPITEDGHFLAYKAIKSNYKDKYSGTIDNRPGTVVEVPRGDVDDNRSHECSHGLHVGAFHYVQSYGVGQGDKFVIVKINPKDAVSVPRDYSAQKLRVCRYEVLMEVERQTVLGFPVYSADGNSYNSLADYDSDQDWESVEAEEEREEYLNNLWKKDGEEEDGWTEAEKSEFLAEAAQEYGENYDRDNLCRLAFERGVTKSVEAGRQLGKACVQSLLAKQDLEDEMAAAE